MEDSVIIEEHYTCGYCGGDFFDDWEGANKCCEDLKKEQRKSKDSGGQDG